MISVIVPVYNKVHYLTRCIDSVLSQNSSCDVELVLVDDGSTDGSGELCDRIKTGNPSKKIIVLHQKNKGQIASRVAGYNSSSGDYALFLDADDFFDCDAISELLTYVRIYEPDCLIFGYKRIRNNEFVSETAYDFASETVVTDKSQLLRIVFRNTEHNSLCRKMIRKSRVSLTDPAELSRIRNGEDLFQCLEVYKQCDSFLFVPKNFYNYTILDDSVSHSLTAENYSYDFLEKYRVFVFLQEQSYLTKKDRVLLENYLLIGFIKHLIKISWFNSPYPEKRTIYKNIRNSLLYKSYISQISIRLRVVGLKILFFHLYRLSMYRFLVFLARLFRAK